MKRLALVVGAVLAVGCTSTNINPPPQVLSPNDILVVNPQDGGEAFLYIAATSGNELRVIDLGPSLLLQDFVRAPNPLEPMSIPVLDQPVALAVDTTYNSAGNQVTGPFVYVRGAGVQQISVVDTGQAAGSTAFSGQVEVERILTSGVVTALAAVGPTASHDGGGSELFAATYDGQAGTIWRYDIPLSLALKDAGAVIPAPTVVATTALGESVSALLTLPTDNRLVVATRTAADGGGRTMVLDTTGTEAPLALNFPAPVRLLRTHPAVPFGGEPDGGPALPSGYFTYGLLDESSCGGGKTCRGLMAVVTSTGQVATDGTGLPMLPIQDPQAGPIQGFDFIPGGALPNATLLYDGGCPNAFGSCQFGLLGVASTGGAQASGGSLGGELFFFDGVRMQLFGAPAPLVDGGIQLEELISPNGVAVLDAGPGLGFLPSTLVLQPGGTFSENLTITFQGLLPFLTNVGVSGFDGGFLATSLVAVQVSSDPAVPPVPLIEPGDFVSLTGLPGGGTCSDTVGQVVPPPAIPGIILTSALDGGAGLPPECQGFQSFTVSAGVLDPYIVAGSVSGFLGRVSAPGTFAGGAYYYRQPGVDVVVVDGGTTADGGSVDAGVAAAGVAPITFQMGPPDPQVELPDGGPGDAGPGAQYLTVLSAPFYHFYFWPDPTVFAGGLGIPAGLVPGALASYQLPNQDQSNLNFPEFVFVSYPARNGVLRLDPRDNVYPTTIASYLALLFFGGG
jgi:hypothetical protein